MFRKIGNKRRRLIIKTSAVLASRPICSVILYNNNNISKNYTRNIRLYHYSLQYWHSLGMILQCTTVI